MESNFPYVPCPSCGQDGDLWYAINDPSDAMWCKECDKTWTVPELEELAGRIQEFVAWLRTRPIKK